MKVTNGVPEISIRACRMDETGAVIDIWKRTGAYSPSDTGEAVRRHLADQPGMLLVALSGGNIIGTVMGGWDGWRGNIYRLAVLPEYRKQGVGKLLVRVIEELLYELGAQLINVQVEKAQTEGLHFWEAMRETGYRPDVQSASYTKEPEKVLEQRRDTGVI